MKTECSFFYWRVNQPLSRYFFTLTIAKLTVEPVLEPVIERLLFGAFWKYLQPSCKSRILNWSDISGRPINLLNWRGPMLWSWMISGIVVMQLFGRHFSSMKTRCSLCWLYWDCDDSSTSYEQDRISDIWQLGCSSEASGKRVQSEGSNWVDNYRKTWLDLNTFSLSNFRRFRPLAPLSLLQTASFRFLQHS